MEPTLFFDDGMHEPLVQAKPVAQLASPLQVDGQAPPKPSHTNGEQVGPPLAPAASGRHVPGVAAQVSHEPEQGKSQQKPLAHPPPVAHSRHPSVKQSWPATALQASPCIFRGTHAIVAEQ
jgi:hypothetical protein